MKRNGNAKRRRCDNRGAEGADRGEWGPRWGYPPPQWGPEGSGEGPEFFFDFLSGNGAFWCILGACFNVSIRHVKQSRKVVLCTNCQLVSNLTWRTYHPWYHTHKHIHIRVSSQPVRHTCSLYYGHSRHTRTCYRLSLYRATTFMHFISRDSTRFH